MVRNAAITSKYTPPFNNVEIRGAGPPCSSKFIYNSYAPPQNVATKHKQLINTDHTHIDTHRAGMPGEGAGQATAVRLGAAEPTTTWVPVSLRPRPTFLRPLLGDEQQHNIYLFT